VGWEEVAAAKSLTWVGEGRGVSAQKLASRLATDLISRSRALRA
jgi:hypothetical protein